MFCSSRHSAVRNSFAGESRDAFVASIAIDMSQSSTSPHNLYGSFLRFLQISRYSLNVIPPKETITAL